MSRDIHGLLILIYRDKMTLYHTIPNRITAIDDMMSDLFVGGYLVYNGWVLLSNDNEHLVQISYLFVF